MKPGGIEPTNFRFVAQHLKERTFILCKCLLLNEAKKLFSMLYYQLSYLSVHTNSTCPISYLYDIQFVIYILSCTYALNCL